jgi:hypothetical protein
MTYAEEKKIKDAAKAAKAKKFVYEPVPFDPTLGLAAGQIVVKTQPYGCPKNGTMGMTYVADTEGKFLGMVCLNSLKPVTA